MNQDCTVRDRVVLDAIVRCWDAQPEGPGPTYRALADTVTLDIVTVADSVARLAAREFIAVHVDGPVYSWQIRAIAPDARSMLRQLPAEELYAYRLMRALEHAADHAAEDSPQRLRLQQTAHMMSNLGRDTLVEICAHALGNATAARRTATYT
jgi:hypothetical protein